MRVVLATGAILDLLFGSFMLLLPYDRLLPDADETTRRLAFGGVVEAAGLTLLTAWCGWLALRWLPRHPAQSLVLATGLGALMVVLAAVHTAHGAWQSLLFTGVRGVLLLGAIALVTMRDRAKR